MKNAAVLTLCSLLLAGCAATVTPTDLETTPMGNSLELMVEDAPPAVVYRRILQRARDCLQSGGTLVQGDWFEDQAAGRVSVVLASSPGSTLATASVKRASAGGSSVKVSWYAPQSGRPSAFATPMPVWAKGDAGECLNDKFRPREEPRVGA